SASPASGSPGRAGRAWTWVRAWSNRFAGMSNADPWANKAERWLLPKVYHDVAAVIGWKAAVDLGMWVYETRRPPSRQMRRNGDRRGCLSVPKGESTSVAREIAVVIGADNARDFQKAFCGET